MEHDAVSRLRKIAELNFCHDCYNKYRALVEPSIMLLLARPLHACKSVLARHYTDYSPERLKRIYDKAGLTVLS